jgi:hypothetical protein
MPPVVLPTDIAMRPAKEALLEGNDVDPNFVGLQGYLLRCRSDSAWSWMKVNRPLQDDPYRQGIPV